MTTDGFIVTISALVTGLGVTGWLLKAAYTGTEVDTRHRCEVPLHNGKQPRPCGRAAVTYRRETSGDHWLCNKHAGWDW